MEITTEQQNFIDSLIGKRIIVTSKKHPRFGETGTIKTFYPVVGITGKPGFEIKADEGDGFFVFSGADVRKI
jgi:hypothetical protein